jgi:hypothetical protein
MSMGMRNRCSTVINNVVVNVNPNPKNFKIVSLMELENTYVEINYPDCKNYEGNKVLVYKGKVGKQLIQASEIDPHFTPEGLSPIARFAPTFEGRYIAMQITKGNYGHD